MLVDLHVHSTCSDGSLSIEELVQHALRNNVRTVALCDHDTTDGARQFETTAHAHGLRGIGGVELSATWSSGNCHICGLNVRDTHQPLETVLKEIRDSRGGRNEKIIAKLNELGIDISLEEVASLAGGDVVGRPHMARLMVTKGYVTSTQEAFDKYLAKGAPAYMDRHRLDPAKAVRLLREAGAVVVLAHPSQLKLDIPELSNLVGELCDAGLQGMEVYTPYTTDENLHSYLQVARDHDLWVTGGSDFHGESKPAHFMGYYRDNSTPIPSSILENAPL